jgi:hypothetical protein
MNFNEGFTTGYSREEREEQIAYLHGIRHMIVDHR